MCKRRPLSTKLRALRDTIRFSGRTMLPPSVLPLVWQVRRGHLTAPPRALSLKLLVLRIVLIGARLNDSARGSEVCIGAVRRRNVEQCWDTLRIG